MRLGSSQQDQEQHLHPKPNAAKLIAINIFEGEGAGPEVEAEAPVRARRSRASWASRCWRACTAACTFCAESRGAGATLLPRLHAILPIFNIHTCVHPSINLFICEFVHLSHSFIYWG